jgi:hypothetical protein
LADPAAVIVDALSRAVAEPGGLPLHGTKRVPGLFPSGAPAKQAARQCIAENYLHVVSRRTLGQRDLEIWAITEAGLDHLLRQRDPRPVLEELVRGLEARHQEIGELIEAVHRAQASLQAMRLLAEKTLATIENTPSTAAAIGLHLNGNGFISKPVADSTAAVLEQLTSWQATAGSADCPLPELFHRTATANDNLSTGQFHDCLRRLHKAGRLALHPWTGPLYEIPEPAYALMIGHALAYYASLTTG